MSVLLFIIGIIIGGAVGFFGAFHLVYEDLQEMTEKELLHTHRMTKEMANEIYNHKA